MTFFVVEMASFLSALLRGLRRLARTASSSGFRRDVGLIWSDGANSVFADERAFLRTPGRRRRRGKKEGRRDGPLSLPTT